MTPEQWERLQALLEAALDLPPGERYAFAESACGGDAELGAELCSLLAASEHVHEEESLPASWFGLLSTPEPPRFDPGAVVSGRYRIESLLGRGGMGEVYEAWDGDLSIPVALKTLHLTVSTEEARRRLRLEGLLARAVWHPNVCRLYDLGCHGEGDDAVWFLTMELLHGPTLAERLQEEGSLAPDRARRLAEQMAAGLGAAHRAGIVHRDFKPANVLLVKREDGEQAVVTDFGIARADSPTPTPSWLDREGGPIVGTPTYMAPEQLRGDRIGPATDVYALGVVLFEMVTGRLPFADDAPTDTAPRRLSEDAPSPRALRPELDEQWERAILRCLERDPAKRFPRAEDVSAVLAGRAPAGVVDALPGAGRRSHSLTAERDKFIGREVELGELEHNLAGASLVTLTGAGGMGKTRLAIRYGWRTLHQWQGGVWFCDLAEARDENALAVSVAQSFGIELGPADPIGQLGHTIAARGRCLVILDNFEQLVPYGAATVGRWLLRAVEAKFLVTSRERLFLGEQEVVQRAEALSPEAGFDLFRARSRWLRPGFECSGRDADAAREIVRLVDGMPLAIELAAARICVMSATQILQEMRRRFSLLTGGGSARHETLAGAIEGSWELLNARERSAWAQSSVFEGNFTLEAAEAVLAFDQAADAPKVADILQSLVEKSLLRTSAPAPDVEGSPAALRFGMLASLQEFARIKLRPGPDDGKGQESDGLESEDAALRRHGDWYARVGTGAERGAIETTGSGQWRDLEAELGNIVQACRRAVVRGDGRTAAAALRGCHAVLSRRGPHGALVDLGLDVLRTPGLGDAQRAWVLMVVGSAESSAGLTAEGVAHSESALALFRAIGDHRGECDVLGRLALSRHLMGETPVARRCAETTIALSREIGAREQECIVLGYLGELDYNEGRAEEARASWELALSIARELGHRASEASNLINLGTLYFDEGRLEEAQSCFESALEIDRDAGGRVAQGVALGNLGHLCQARGLLDEAVSRFQEALAIHKEVGYRRYEGAGLADLGNLYRERGEMQEARSCLEAALSIHREVGNRFLEGRALSDLGLLHFENGRLRDAAGCYRSALAMARDTQNRLLEAITLYRLGALHRLAGRVSESRSALSESEAVLRPLGDLFEVSRLLCTRADLELDSGDRASALATFQEAERLAMRTGSGPNTELRRMVAKLRGRLGVASGS